MKRRKFITGLLAATASICACNQKEKPRYDAKECPFCKGDPGKCLYCGGTGKCSYCNGTGKRNTETLAVPGSNTKKVVLPETCPFCKGTGKCHYCEGSGKCRVCKGTGKMEKWEW